MPSGKTHNRINQSILITTILVAIFHPMPNIWWFILGMNIGLNYLGPDLDKNNTRQDQNWGVYGLIWNIYAKLMPHRGSSHHIFGIVTRLLFLSPFLFIVHLKYPMFIELNIEAISITLMGIILNDLLHIAEDKILKKVK